MSDSPVSVGLRSVISLLWCRNFSISVIVSFSMVDNFSALHLSSAGGGGNGFSGGLSVRCVLIGGPETSGDGGPSFLRLF